MARISHLQDPLINHSIPVGTFSVSIEIADPSERARATVTALVDTGATLTVAPASLLHSLGIQPTQRWRFQLGDGRIVEWPAGDARVTVEGRTAPTLVVFGEEDVESTLGVVVLETVGLTIDPGPPGRLIPKDALLMH